MRKVMKSALGKCSAVWNKTSRSVQAAEAIKSLVGYKLPKPVVTRWNSTFDSINTLLKAKPQFDSLFAIAGTPKLTVTETEFLEDYVAAMQPIAWALDKLQSEKNFYFAALAPTILLTKVKLKSVIDSDTNECFTSVIASELLAGLEQRFQSILNFQMNLAKPEILAAVTLPMFKMRWVPIEMRDSVKSAFIAEAKKFVKSVPSRNENESEKCSTDWDDLFVENQQSVASHQPSSSVEVECLTYLQDTATAVETLVKYPVIKDMFLYYNTALPSSAPAERLFSFAGMIFRPNRANLSDDLFEMLCFLKLYQD